MYEKQPYPHALPYIIKILCTLCTWQIYNKKNYLALSLISKTWFYNSMLPMIIHNQPFHPLQTGKKQPESSLKKLKQLLINKKASHQTEISIYII